MGTVTLDGAPPSFRSINMQGQPQCLKQNPTPVVPPVVVLGPGNTLGNVVIYVKPNSSIEKYRFDTPATPVTLDQESCMYVPRVVALMTHQTLLVKNTDPTSHNVHVMPKLNKQWNLSLAAGAAPLETRFDLPELAIPVMCNIHTWMRAYIFVFEHPYFAVTPAEGTFELSNLPPGSYTIEAWHEKFGTLDQTVSIASKESKPISFTFKSTATR